jgi:dTDP-4-amino-4,6-dideoxygalactose transaminase
VIGLPLANSTWDEREIAALNRVIASGRFTMGDEVRAFEHAFAAHVGSRHCVMLNSGSSANLAAVAALSLRRADPLARGDEVIVPAVSWSTTYFPLHQYGLKLRFVDIDRDTLNLDLAQLESAITPRTRLIVAVNLLGNPLDYERLFRIVDGRDIDVLEDNCEGLGAALAGKQAGTFGRIGTFSSFFSHHISTMEGGMAVTDDDELYHLMLSLRAHGWTRDLPQPNRVCQKLDDPFAESWRFVVPGYNLRPLEMSGAVGTEQLRKLPEIVRARRENAKSFQQLFGSLPGFRVQRETGDSSWFGFALILEDAGLRRDEVLSELASEGVETRPIVAGNFLRNPAIRYLDHAVHGSLDQADAVADRGFLFGNHHYDIAGELESIASLLRRRV